MDRTTKPVGTGSEAPPEHWKGSRAAAASIAPIDQWRLALSDSMLLDANAALSIVFTCPAGQLRSARGCVFPREVQGHFDAAFMKRFLPRIERRETVPHLSASPEVYAPLEEARDKRLAAEVRRGVLGPVGALGLLNAFLVDSTGAIIGWVALGTREPCRDALTRIGEEMTHVVTIASRTLQTAMSMARGCLAVAPTPVPATNLTVREKQIVDLIASGLSDLNVANRLGLKEETIGSHLRRIYAKLGIHSRVELVRMSNAS